MEIDYIPIEKLTEAIIDYRGKTPPKTEEGVRLITAKVIKDGRILDDKKEYIADDFYDTWMRRGLPYKWDILLTTEAPLGEVAQIRNTKRVALAQRVILLRGNPELIDQQYFFQSFKSPFVQAGLNARSTGTTVLGIKQSELRKVEIPLPPLTTQRKIATILSAYDDLIENNTRRIAILEEMAQRIYKEWFVDFKYPGHENDTMVDSELGMIPDGWEVSKVNDLVSMRSGFAFKSKTFDDNGKYGLVTIKNVQEGTFNTTCQNHLNSLPERMPDYCNLITGDILLSLTGNIGRVCLLYGDNYLLNQRVSKLEPKQKTYHEFIYTMFRNNDFQKQLELISTGVAQQNLSPVLTGEQNIVKPEEKILAKFSNISKPMLKEMILLNLKNQTLRQTRDLLLPKLISGKVDVSELDINIGADA